MTDQTLKQNKGKVPVYQGCLMYFPRALQAVSQVSEYGTKKYDVPFTTQGWRLVPADELRDALVRHILDRVIDGDVNSVDGDLLHQAQVAWEALAVLEVMLEANAKAKSDNPIYAVPGGLAFAAERSKPGDIHVYDPNGVPKPVTGAGAGEAAQAVDRASGSRLIAKGEAIRKGDGDV
jgi:hypothetical protein